VLGAEEFQLGASPLNKEQHKTLSKKACHHCLGQTNPTSWKPPTEEQIASFYASYFAISVPINIVKYFHVLMDVRLSSFWPLERWIRNPSRDNRCSWSRTGLYDMLSVLIPTHWSCSSLIYLLCFCSISYILYSAKHCTRRPKFVQYINVQSFEALNPRAVAVVIDPIQKRTIDFRFCRRAVKPLRLRHFRFRFCALFGAEFSARFTNSERKFPFCFADCRAVESVWAMVAEALAVGRVFIGDGVWYSAPVRHHRP
jgi:hypothetical protein